MSYKGKKFGGGLTFRQRDRWVSELDWCLISTKGLDNVVSFEVLQEVKLHTNHAPIALELGNFKESLPSLLERSKWLGQSHTPKIQLYRRPIRLNQIDHKEFISSLPPPDERWYESPDINYLAESASKTIYNTALISQNKPTDMLISAPPPVNNAHQRWSKLASTRDSRDIWKTIDWKGSYQSSPDNLESPSVADFCRHHEKLMNPPVNEPAEQWSPTSQNYVPFSRRPFVPRGS